MTFINPVEPITGELTEQLDDCDIIFGDGEFIQYPEGVQQQ